MDNILLIGAGGHAKSCIDIIESSNEFKVFGLVENTGSVKKILGYKILGGDQDLNKLIDSVNNAHIAIGSLNSINLRSSLFQRVKEIGFNTPAIFSQNSYISKNSIVELGSIIMHDVFINTNSKIGINSIINSKTLIEHDVSIGNNCHICPGKIINGGVEIGNNVFIGSGAIIFPGIKIASNKIISAGNIIRSNI